MKRQCGDCTECCFYLGVAELNKGKSEECEHCSGVGCKIYDQRPNVCREWYCAWAASSEFLQDNLRPKDSGLLMYFSPSILGPTLFIQEIRTGSFQEHTDTIASLIRRGPTVMDDIKGIRTTTCPPDHPSHHMLSSSPLTLKKKSLKVLQGDY